ncbi:hypothetical protein [Flavobacterium sp. 245]|uniref:hypothetical protein n=1 Tax=Flavobacterium sp. 245 TaxID=2512115 RepID=UPI00105D026E|nr:hypothetical protein [Flavobacterium sp. 245]TDO95000.1 hypothetical protein EV145_11591 [Flavobacterium sp. 245]
MNIASKKYNHLFVILFLLTNSFSYSQCLCAEIKFKLSLDDNASSYSIKTTHAPNFALIENWRDFNEHESNGKSVNFEFDTKGGIDSLIFVIRNNKTNKTMKVNALHLGPDHEYLIDLTEFTEGDFLFDWKKINQCQRKFRNTELIECEKIKFYQLQIITEKELKETSNFYIRNKIKPFNLEYFRNNKDN